METIRSEGGTLAGPPHEVARAGGVTEVSGSNDARLLAAFAGALGIDAALVHEQLAYNSIPEWDSVAHMSFVTEVETLFGIMLDTDDIIDMSSYGAIKRILGKYGVQFGE